MKVVRSIAIVSVLCIICAIDTTLSAQTRANISGTGGVNTVRGQIFTPGNKRIDGSVTVRLQSTTFGELTLVTDQSGGFEFRSLAAGTYALVIDAGETFEVAREYITIDADVQTPVSRRPTPKLYTVPVYLQFKHHWGGSNGVINAKLVNVPKDALKHYEKGLELAQTGKPAEAVGEFKQAIGIYPSLSVAYVELGKIYLETHRTDDAVNALHQALLYDPTDFDATVNYGIALYARADFVAAEPELNKAATLNVTAVTPHYYLGLLFIQTKKLDRAQEELEAAKRLKGDKNFPLLHRYLGGVYLARNLSKQAVAELETYIKLEPNAKDADRIRQTIADLRSKID